MILLFKSTVEDRGDRGKPLLNAETASRPSRKNLPFTPANPERPVLAWPGVPGKAASLQAKSFTAYRSIPVKLRPSSHVYHSITQDATFVDSRGEKILPIFLLPEQMGKWLDT